MATGNPRPRHVLDPLAPERLVFSRRRHFSTFARALRVAGVLVTVMLASSTACARHRPDPSAAPEEQAGPTTVRVQNQGFLDVAVYVVRGGVRSRLGTVTGNSTAVLTIPKTFVQPLTQLRFLANPIGGQRQPVSEEITVSPGDAVELAIPPGSS